MDKLHSYQGWSGRFHEWRDSLREWWAKWRQENPQTVIELLEKRIYEEPPGRNDSDYSHIYRTKTRAELLKVSAAVMGIEFSYAAETAFVSPTLLSIGVPHQHMTLVWALSPLVGLICTPIMGSLSDRCRFSLGRRRPFIILFSIGIFIGLLLVPNGEDIGYSLGDFNPYEMNVTSKKISIVQHRTTASESKSINIANTSHPWGIFITIIGTVLLDFDADACQSPSRAYLLDVTLPADHAKGLSMFTIMADTAFGVMLGGHVRAVFTLVTIIFIICVYVTLNSFREIPLSRLEMMPNTFPNEQENQKTDLTEQTMLSDKCPPGSCGKTPFYCYVQKIITSETNY